MTGAGARFMVGLLAIGLVACTAPALSPPAVPSDPAIVCAARSDQRPPTTLTCGAAVAVALAVLPGDHLPIIRVEFVYGPYCPPSRHCLALSDQHGYVVFTTKGRGPALWVTVVADERGKVSLTDEVRPFPPS